VFLSSLVGRRRSSTALGPELTLDRGHDRLAVPMGSFVELHGRKLDRIYVGYARDDVLCVQVGVAIPRLGDPHLRSCAILGAGFGEFLDECGLLRNVRRLRL